MRLVPKLIRFEKYLIRFLEVMRGALMAAPIKLLPVIYIPLQIPIAQPDQRINSS